MRFSERMGFKPVRTVIQVDSMDDALRNGLWNALTVFYWTDISDGAQLGYLKKVSPHSRYDDPIDEFAKFDRVFMAGLF